MTVSDIIDKKLRNHINISLLDIVDESHLHAGHAGARPGGESHFKLRIVSEDFKGLSRVQRHQKVYAILADELKSTIHALALSTLTPDEDHGC